MNTNDELRAMLDERDVNWDYGITGAATTKFRANGVDLTFMSMRDGLVCTTILTPAQAIAATLGSDRLAFLEEKVRLQGDYIIKLTKEYDALFAQSCEAATRHAGQIDAMQRKLEAATLGAGTCKEVYLLMATDIGDGREEVLGAYATEEAAIAAINENQFGYALHHVCKLEVTL